MSYIGPLQLPLRETDYLGVDLDCGPHRGSILNVAKMKLHPNDKAAKSQHAKSQAGAETSNLYLRGNRMLGFHMELGHMESGCGDEGTMFFIASDRASSHCE